MGPPDVPVKEIKTARLIEKLAAGWRSSHAGLALELVHRWAARFETAVEVREVYDDAVYFTLELPNLRLRSMDEVRCLLVGGDSNPGTTMQEFWHRQSSPHHLPFILTLSEAAHEAGRSLFAHDYCLLLSSAQLQELFAAPDAHAALRRLLWRQVPKRTLIPYNILMPANNVTFFGRENELRRLMEEDAVSFAIAGPGRIGKTSLVMRYRRARLRQRRTAAAWMHYVSFYQTTDAANSAAKFLATQIESTKRSDRVTDGDLVNFLRYKHKVGGGPLDLVLDEVDEVCKSDTFHFLGEAARLGYCRLVLCGRGTLLKTMLDRSTPIEGRLELIRLEPLPEGPARDLLLNPLTDLGFELPEPDALVEQVFELTGRLPHHIQMFGKKLAELAISEGSNRITAETLGTLKCDFLVAQYFTKMLDEIRDARTRLVGLALLKADRRDVPVPVVQEVARREGLTLTSREANDICLDLAIDNILAWEHGGFRLANTGLSFFTSQTGYLDGALEDARLAISVGV